MYVTIVQGAGGDGKTTMMLTIVAMLTNGKMPPTLENGFLTDSPETKPESTFFLTTQCGYCICGTQHSVGRT